METIEENFESRNVVNTHILLLGTLVFLGVVFVSGVLVNIPAVVIYIRSKQLRGFTDKFILFILISDVITLITFLPASFLTVLEISNNLSVREQQKDGYLQGRPLFSDSNDFLKGSKTFYPSSNDEDVEFSSFCVQQWTFIIHQFLFILTANLAVLGAVKITLERYLAVVAPLHYHKILKSSLIFFVSFTSFLMSLAFAVVSVMDSEDTPATQIASQCAPKSWKRYFWAAASSLSSKQSQVISMQLNQDEGVEGDESTAASNKVISTIQESLLSPLPTSVWWWPVLKLVHALVFFVIPIISMIYMYLRIWSEARKQNARMAYHSKTSFILPPDAKKTGGISVDGLQQIFAKFKLVQRIKRKARLDRAAKVALLTIGLLTLCFGMLYFVQILMAISALTNSNMFADMWDMRGKGQSMTTSTFLHLLPMLLASLHPLLSPLVYVYRYKRVRNELKSLFSSMISSVCCRCNHDIEKGTKCDCQAVVNQFNQLAEKLPDSGFDAAVSQQMLESQASSSSVSISQSDVTITIDLQCPSVDGDGLESIVSDLPPESDLESQEYSDHRDISSQSDAPNGFLQLFNCWMSSYSRRWSQHRESVTSTASFITLLSTRSKVPSTDI